MKKQEQSQIPSIEHKHLVKTKFRLNDTVLYINTNYNIKEKK